MSISPINVGDVLPSITLKNEKGEDVVGKDWNVRTGVHEVSTIETSSRSGRFRVLRVNSTAESLQLPTTE